MALRRHALARIIDTNPGHGGLAGVRIGPPVATADGVPDIRAHSGSTLTRAPAVAVALSFGAVVARPAIVAAHTRRLRTFTLVINTHSGPRGDATVRISTPVAAADRVPDNRTVMWSRLAHALPLAITICLRAVAVRATILARITRDRDRFTFALVIDIDAVGGRGAGVRVSTPVAPTDRGPQSGTYRWPGSTRSLAFAITRRLGAIAFTVTVVVGLARNRSRFTFAAIVDTHTRDRGDTGVRVSTPVAAANRVQQCGTYRRPGFAGSLAFTIARFLCAIAVIIAVVVCLAGNRNRLTFTPIIDVDAGSSGVTNVRIGASVTAADGIPQINADLGARLTHPSAVTIARPFGAVLALRTLIVGRAYVRDAFAAVVDVDSGNGGEAGVGICFSIASADRIPQARACFRSLFTHAFAVTVSGPLGAVLV